MDCLVYGVTKSWTRVSDFHFHFSYIYLLNFQRFIFIYFSCFLPNISRFMLISLLFIFFNCSFLFCFFSLDDITGFPLFYHVLTLLTSFLN